MESKLLRIKLKPNSESKVHQLIEKMQRDIAYVKDEMDQLGYHWDSVFMGKVHGDTYLYIVGKSKDWSKKKPVQAPTPFREYYDQFRAECWDDSDQVDQLWCLNTAFEFIG